jgi:hypothetical protein
MFGIFDSHSNDGHALDYLARNLQGKLTSWPKWMLLAYHARNLDLLASLIVSACHNLDKGLRGDTLRPMRDGRTMAIIVLVCNCHLIVSGTAVVSL